MAGPKQSYGKNKISNVVRILKCNDRNENADLFVSWKQTNVIKDQVDFLSVTFTEIETQDYMRIGCVGSRGR